MTIKPQPDELKNLPRLGIIAGAGELPVQVIQACKARSQPVFVVAIEGKADKSISHLAPHIWLELGKVGEAITALKEAAVHDMVLVGRVGRPAVADLSLDYTAFRLLSKLGKLKSHGDNAVFSTIISFFEKAGFSVVGVDSVLSDLLIHEGVLGSVKPDKVALRDIEIGRKAAITIGQLDIGQAVIVQQGVVLGVEGLEGTDKLMERCSELRAKGAGGVLVKMKKPNQDSRVDLPSIGITTIENAHKAGLRGIAVEAGGSLVIGRDALLARAAELGIFVVGIAPPQ